MNIEEAYNKIKKERKLQTNFEELELVINYEYSVIQIELI